jgi:hypothetical protein
MHGSKDPPLLGAEEIGLEAGVAVFVGPEGEGDGGEVIHERDGVAIFREVDGAQIEFAGIAGFDADVGELLRGVHGELVFGFFAAGRAQEAAKLPFFGAEGAEQEAFAAVAFGTQDAEQRA